MTASTQDRATPTRTLGLNHVNLVVADIATSAHFYCDALGFEPHREQAGITFLTTPGAGDLLALQSPSEDLDRSRRAPRRPGQAGGVDHIGFAVADPEVLDELLARVEAAGGIRRARFVEPGGAHTAFVTDPDGYLLQLTAPAPG